MGASVAASAASDLPSPSGPPGIESPAPGTTEASVASLPVPDEASEAPAIVTGRGGARGAATLRPLSRGPGSVDGGGSGSVADDTHDGGDDDGAVSGPSVGLVSPPAHGAEEDGFAAEEDAFSEDGSSPHRSAVREQPSGVEGRIDTAETSLAAADPPAEPNNDVVDDYSDDLTAGTDAAAALRLADAGLDAEASLRREWTGLEAEERAGAATRIQAAARGWAGRAEASRRAEAARARQARAVAAATAREAAEAEAAEAEAAAAAAEAEAAAALSRRQQERAARRAARRREKEEEEEEEAQRREAAATTIQAVVRGGASRSLLAASRARAEAEAERERRREAVRREAAAAEARIEEEAEEARREEEAAAEAARQRAAAARARAADAARRAREAAAAESDDGDDYGSDDEVGAALAEPRSAGAMLLGDAAASAAAEGKRPVSWEGSGKEEEEDEDERRRGHRSAGAPAGSRRAAPKAGSRASPPGRSRPSERLQQQSDAWSDDAGRAGAGYSDDDDDDGEYGPDDGAGRAEDASEAGSAGESDAVRGEMAALARLRAETEALLGGKAPRAKTAGARGASNPGSRKGSARRGRATSTGSSVAASRSAPPSRATSPGGEDGNGRDATLLGRGTAAPEDAVLHGARLHPEDAVDARLGSRVASADVWETEVARSVLSIYRTQANAEADAANAAAGPRGGAGRSGLPKQRRQLQAGPARGSASEVELAAETMARREGPAGLRALKRAGGADSSRGPVPSRGAAKGSARSGSRGAGERPGAGRPGRGSRRSSPIDVEGGRASTTRSVGSRGRAPRGARGGAASSRRARSRGSASARSGAASPLPAVARGGAGSASARSSAPGGRRSVSPAAGRSSPSRSGRAASSGPRPRMKSGAVAPIWFGGGGGGSVSARAVWSGLAKPDSGFTDEELSEALAGLEREGRYGKYLDVVERLLLPQVRAEGRPDLAAQQWRQAVVASTVFAAKYCDEERWSQALTTLRRAQEMTGSDPHMEPAARRELSGFVLDGFASYYYRRRWLQAALQASQKATRAHASLSQWDHVAKCHLHTACILSRMNKHGEAARTVGKVLRLVEADRLEGDGDSRGASPQKLCLVAVAYHNVAVEHVAAGQGEDACIASQNARRVARLCLGLSGRYAASFEATHAAALAQIEKAKGVASAVASDSRKLHAFRKLTAALYA